MTRNYACGRVALGERNSFNFPLGWVTVDWQEADFTMQIDDTTTLPLPSGSQRIVYSAHMFEHVEQSALEQLLREVHRILAPRGAMRIEVPDAERLIAAYRNDDRMVLDYFRRDREYVCRELGLGEEYLDDHLTPLGVIANHIDRGRGDSRRLSVPVYAPKAEFDRRLAQGIDALNDWAQSLKTELQRTSGGHANAMTFDRLASALKKAGFSDVRRAAFGVTTIPGLRLGRGVRRLYDSVPEQQERAFYSLYVEAFA